MKKLFVTSAILLMPMLANAAIPYRVEMTKLPDTTTDIYSDLNTFYIGGAYNFAMWQNYTDDHDISISRQNTHSFEAMAGMRIYDTVRMELNYIKTDAQWREFSFTGDTAMINAIFDARIDSMYRLFRTQMLVPYIGVGAGLSWNKAENNVHLDTKITPVMAALAGISVEFNPIFALDFGYRYFYMFKPETDIISGFNPTSHQFRAGARISF